MSNKLPNHFPLGTHHAKTGDWIPGWKRTYPSGMSVKNPHDHLAVASGALARYEDDPGRFTQKGNQWVEDLSGIPFDEVDVPYLDYILGTKSNVAHWVAAYANDEGKWRFAADSVFENGQVLDADQCHEVGWMYSNLATFLAYQARRDQSEVRTASGFCPSLDDTPQDFWYEGAQWFDERPDWIPGRHQAGLLLDRIRSKKLGVQYTRVPSGMEVNQLVGSVKWRAMVQVTTKAGEPVFDLPSRWMPDEFGTYLIVDTGHSQETVWVPNEMPTFLDRHAWDAALWAADELRTLYTRVVEDGELCVPEGEDLGPVAWVRQRVDEIMSLVPNGGDPKLTAFLKEVVEKAARAVMAEAYKIYTEVPEAIDLAAWCEVVEAEITRKRKSFGVKVTRVNKDVALELAGVVHIDYAVCEVVA